MIIEVTQEHLDIGARADARCCPVAMAYRAAGVNVAIGSVGITMYKKHYPHTKRLMHYIAAIDASAVVKPARFRVPNLPR